MMRAVHRIDGSSANALEGLVEYDWSKLTWNLAAIGSTFLLAPATFTLDAFLIFILLTYTSLLVGHSVGMHRLMIHRSFDCHPAVEKLLIYIGVLVGMSGPHGILKIHDLRDWAQRQTGCHDFFSHKRSYLKDLYWQLSCKFTFEKPPKFTIEDKFDTPFYRGLEASWRLQQVPLAILLYLVGGWPYVIWGIPVRIAVSVLGHWSITYFCHNPGSGLWRVKGAAVQASNLPGLGIITYGECWHNNHHAFPESARIGLEKGQYDPAWWFISLLATLGLAHNLGLPRPLTEQEDLYKVDES